MQAAWCKFMVNAGFDKAVLEGAPAHAEPHAPSEQELREAARFFGHELRPTTRYVPDIEALSAARVVVGIGADSRHLLTYRTSVALCELLGTQPVEFPGDHGGFLGSARGIRRHIAKSVGGLTLPTRAYVFVACHADACSILRTVAPSERPHDATDTGVSATNTDARGKRFGGMADQPTSRSGRRSAA